MGMPSAETFDHEQVDAWNRRDLDALLSHYADAVELRSLLVGKLVGDPVPTGQTFRPT